MRISRNQEEFEEFFERAFPPAQPKLPLVIDIYEATKDKDKDRERGPGVRVPPRA